MSEISPQEDTELKPRWHHRLHPSVHKLNARNGLPQCVRGFIHPTHTNLRDSSGNEQAWTSRSHRKHRLVLTSPRSGLPRTGTTLLRNLAHFGRVEYWNISWWVAVAFTLGSIIWVVNGFVAFLPEVDPSHFNKSDAASGWTAWFGATVFEIGSVFGMWEAWNRGDAADFGWAVEELHHKRNDKELSMTTPAQLPGSTKNPKRPVDKWIWFSLNPKYWHELGYLAAFSQFWAATIFWISGFTAIPTIQSAISSNAPLLDGVFWSPQVVGGSGFIISAAFIMLEAQEKWYKPSVKTLGWQVGFWNMVGAIGFTLCGALGYAADSNSGVAYQSVLSTFWGSWGFLIGSIIQWYESVNSI